MFVRLLISKTNQSAVAIIKKGSEGAERLRLPKKKSIDRGNEMSIK